MSASKDKEFYATTNSNTLDERSRLAAMTALPLTAAFRRASDKIILGNTASEAAGHLAAQNAVTGTDANGLSFRRLNVGGKITFDLPCDPNAQNYLTVRLNGSETNSGYLYLVQGDGGKDVLDPTS